MDIFAHRGASFDAPENTLPAFELALKQGCRALELDIQMTADGELVVIHDETIDRTTDGTGYVKDQTLASLKQRDAGSWFSPAFRGTTIPTLSEVLSLLQKDHLVNIEIKNIPIFYPQIEEKLIAQLDRFGCEENIIISSFDHHALKRIQDLRPQLKMGVLLANHLLEPWRYVREAGLKAYSIHPMYTFVDPVFVEKCHAEGFKIYPFTVDERRTYQHLERLGVDGIFTNIPSRFLK